MPHVTEKVGSTLLDQERPPHLGPRSAPDVAQADDLIPPARAVEPAPGALGAILPTTASTADGYTKRLNSCRGADNRTLTVSCLGERARVLMRTSRAIERGDRTPRSHFRSSVTPLRELATAL
jgi:hypothetical protein